MQKLSLLKASFFISLEEGDETDIRVHYEEMRHIIVSFAHGTVHWRDIHTGLSIFISEVAMIIEDAIGKKLINYGRRILEIAKKLLRQLELMVETGHFSSGHHESRPVDSKTVTVKKRVTLSAKYTSVCEIINMIISMKMINGGDITASEIIHRVHTLFGLDYPADKYYKTRGEIIRRCPENDERAYFLKAAAKTLNYEYANA